MSEKTSISEKIKGYLGEWHNQDNEKVRLVKLRDKELKKEDAYKALLLEKKKINDQIKEIQESNEFGIQVKTCTADIAMIKENIAEELEIDKPIVSKIYANFKKLFDKQINDLDVVVDAWNEVFTEKGTE